MEEGRYHFVDSSSMMCALGHRLHVVQGPDENIKVTTLTDFYVCQALVDTRENSQIYGF